MRHLKKCREMEGGAALVVDMKKDKAATGSITKAIRRSASVPLAVKNSAGGGMLRTFVVGSHLVMFLLFC